MFIYRVLEIAFLSTAPTPVNDIVYRYSSKFAHFLALYNTLYLGYIALIFLSLLQSYLIKQLYLSIPTLAFFPKHQPSHPKQQLYRNKLSNVFPMLISILVCITTNISIYQNTLTLFLTLLCIFFSMMLLIISFIDYTFFLIPHLLSIPLALGGITFLILTESINNIITTFIFAIIFGLTLILLSLLYKYCCNKEGIGMGDCTLSAILTLWCTEAFMPFIFLFASCSGIIFCLLLRNFKQPVPFAPFLCLPALAGLIIHLYSIQ